MSRDGPVAKRIDLKGSAESPVRGGWTGNAEEMEVWGPTPPRARGWAATDCQIGCATLVLAPRAGMDRPSTVPGKTVHRTPPARGDEPLWERGGLAPRRYSPRTQG